MTNGQVQIGDSVQVALHTAGVDQAVQDPKLVGQVLGAEQLVSEAAADCIFDGFPDSAATSIAGVGSMTRSTLAGTASSASGVAGWGSGWGGADVHAHRLHATARETANALMFTKDLQSDVSARIGRSKTLDPKY